MHDSGLDTDDDLVARHAQGYKLDVNNRRVRAQPGFMTVPWSAGSIDSTTGDLLLWELAIFSVKVRFHRESSGK